MCGIAGYVDFDTGAAALEVLEDMVRTLAHRGPDAHGVHVAGPSGLAHARLSIIDLAGSPQPMTPPGSDVTVTYNGELYNYRELRGELRARGVEFSTFGDTEVLARLIELDGVAALPRLDGMFAFAAWRPSAQALTLARDPLGKKPLFYAVPRQGLLVYASEIKALLRHPAVRAELNLDALRQVMRFRAVYGEHTLYRGIRQLEPGTWMTFSRAGTRTGRYYDIEREAVDCSEDLERLAETDLLGMGRDLLERAVRKRLIADVEVGAFLSGGLDSAVICALAQRERSGGDPLRTFSVGFEDDPFSELPHAQLVAGALGTRHTEVRIAPGDYGADLRKMTWYRDAPVSEPADPAIARMSEAARRDVKVVLSGEGADEVFAGYPKYGFAAAPRPLRSLVRLAGPARSARLAGLLGLDRRRALVAARSLAHHREVDRAAQWFSYLDRQQLAAVLPGLGWGDAQWQQTLSAHESYTSAMRADGPLRRMQVLDCLTWLPCNLLERGDRMTMAFGLELRVPFLDRRVVAFGLALRTRMKIRARQSKWIVRQWARDLVPESISQRKKWGFRVPLAGWFRGDMRELLHDSLGASSTLCAEYGSTRHVARLLDVHDRGEQDLSMELFTLLTAELWYAGAFAAKRSRDREAVLI